MLRRLQIFVGVSAAAFLLTNVVMTPKLQKLHLFGFLASEALSLWFYMQLARMGASQIAADGRIREGGFELDAPGFHQYHLLLDAHPLAI